MEVLPVDLPSRPTSSRSEQEITLKIKRTHNLILNMQVSSGQLLSDYVFLQGDPFGDPSFNPAIQPFPGLPLPALSATDWLGLSDAERLQHNNTVFSNLPVYLAMVKRYQMVLNPSAMDLHRLLESSGVHCLGLADNLTSIMASLGIVAGPPESAESSEADSTFIMKLMGYHICHLFRDWVNRCEKDMVFLAKKYPA